MDKKINRGLREYQTEKSMESQLSILKVLHYDEDWHRYSEIKEKTKLTDTTVTNQLKKLKKIKLIERNLDIESGKYPYPVYYRLNPVYVNAFRGNIRFEETWDEIKEDFIMKKNLLETLNRINKQNNLIMLGILISIKENRHMDDKIKRLLLELLIWKPYKSLTLNLVEEAERMFNVKDLKKFVWEV